MSHLIQESLCCIPRRMASVLPKILAVATSLTAATVVPVGPLLAFDKASYNPAILSLSFTKEASGDSSESPAVPGDADAAFLDLSLITADAPPAGVRVPVSKTFLRDQLREFYRQIAKQASLEVEKPSSPSRQLYALLVAPVRELLEQHKISTVLISADRGLQAVPYAALHDGRSYFGDQYAFSLTPSVRFTSLAPVGRSKARLLAAGVSDFELLAPLPMAESEVRALAEDRPSDVYLNQAFTPPVLLNQLAAGGSDRVHVATHAEFKPGGPSKARLHTGTQPLSLKEFSKIRNRDDADPIELFSLSACRTALGDGDSELGFAGLALQAGSRSAIGTLWYVDDVATSAFFVQFYRYLDQGLPKAEALQVTRRAMQRGLIRLQGDQIIGVDGTPLISQLTELQQSRVTHGLRHPFFWSGIELIGTPW